MGNVKKLGVALLIATFVGVSPVTVTPAYAATNRAGCFFAATGAIGSALGLGAISATMGPVGIGAWMFNLWFGVPGAIYGVTRECR